MILRRFTQHIKEQNWFAIGLEVIILVVGIFLGMQVTEWNDERKDKESEAEYINKLIDDVDASGLLLEQEILLGIKTTNASSVALKALWDKNLTEDNQDKFIEGLKHVDLVPFLRIQNTTMTELIQTGDIKLIQESEIRSELIKFHEAYLTLKVKNDRTLEIWLEKFNEVNQYYSWGPELDTPSLTYDFDYLVQTRSFYNNFRILNGAKYILLKRIKEMKELNNDLKELLVAYSKTI